MKYSYIRRNKSIIKFLIITAILGIIIGIILYSNLSIELKDGINNKLKDLPTLVHNHTNIINHLIIFSVIILLSLIIIGLPICLFYYLYEFISIGYILSALYHYKSISGLLFGSIFIIIYKVLFLLILTYFIICIINYSKKIIINLKSNKSELITNHLQKSIFVLLSILLNDIIIYYVGNKIILLFINLIKI